MTGSGAGGYNTASGAGTISRPTGNGTGVVGGSGSGAGTIGPFMGGIVPAKYYVRFKSRPLYPGPNQDSVSEVFDAVSYGEFRDTDDYDNQIISDSKREYVEGEYNANDTVENNQAAAGQPYFRHQFQMVPAEGLFGTHFQYAFDKLIPVSGDFKYLGLDIHYVPRPELGNEFIMGGGALTNGW
jgi:hypothetical protein